MINFEHYKKLFLKFIDEIRDDKLRQICMIVYNDDRFNNEYGSTKEHHCYEGGLLVHTVELLLNAKSIVYNSQINSVNMDRIITAIIWHDYHKIYEYEPVNGHVNKTNYYHRITHIYGGFAEFYYHARTLEIDIDTINAIGHMILAHHDVHGRIVVPQTLEAKIVQCSDATSAFCEQARQCV